MTEGVHSVPCYTSVSSLIHRLITKFDANSKQHFSGAFNTLLTVRLLGPTLPCPALPCLLTTCRIWCIVVQFDSRYACGVHIESSPVLSLAVASASYRLRLLGKELHVDALNAAIQKFNKYDLHIP